MISVLHHHPIIFKQPKKIVTPCDWVHHIPFAFYIISALKSKIIVELGVNNGNSFNAFCECVDELKLKTNCIGVDFWDENNPESLCKKNNFNELLSYQTIQYPQIASLIFEDFNKVAADFTSKIDLLHLNGSQNIEAIQNDFESWSPHLTSNGVVLIHNILIDNSSSDFNMYWNQIKNKYPSFEFRFGKGLGIVLTGPDINSELNQMYNDLKKSTEIHDFFNYCGECILNKLEVIKLNKVLKI